jgi:FKBP-type peptidyl-prolyl cis-trans isomerase SlyD
MQIAKNAVVSIDYTLTGPDGAVIDTSTGRAPLPYIHGGGNIIPGLENALDGKSVGDSFKVTIPPAQGYGERNPQAVQSVPKAAFQGVPEVKVGMQFRSQGQHGMQVVTVTKVENDTITVDGNHPLAGVTLNFDVTVREVRAATAEEIAHGHVHGPEGHHHH